MQATSFDQERAGRSLNRFTTVLLVGYLAFIALFMVLRRAALSPGHHYMVDALGGHVYGIAAYAVVRGFTTGRLQRLAWWRGARAAEPAS